MDKATRRICIRYYRKNKYKIIIIEKKTIKLIFLISIFCFSDVREGKVEIKTQVSCTRWAVGVNKQIKTKNVCTICVGVFPLCVCGGGGVTVSEMCNGVLKFVKICFF